MSDELKPDPMKTGVGEFCQPGDRREPRWMIMYDDADRTHSVFENEEDAREAFANSEGMGWNCWLFGPTPRASNPAADESAKPVGIVDENDDGLFLKFVYGPNGNPLKRGDKVYAQTAPVASKEAVTLSDALLYPDELTADLREVLGWMCFRCISIAQCLRADGMEIAKRAEDEQATVLHWLTKFVLKHGAEWRPHAGEALKAMRERVVQRDASKAEGQS